MTKLESLSTDPRVTVRRPGAPEPNGRCVVYWMQRAQRALDNPALDVAVEAANALRQPVVIFFAPVPFYPHANLRHYAFLAQGIPDIAERARQRGIGFVLRTLSRALAGEVLRRGEGVAGHRRRKPAARAASLARAGGEETQRAAVDRRC